MSESPADPVTGMTRTELLRLIKDARQGGVTKEEALEHAPLD
jgi:hypothetical protein